MEQQLAREVVEALREVWPAQVSMVGEQRLSTFVENDVRQEDILGEIDRQQDPGARMDLKSALEIIVAALTIVKVLLDIRKLLREAPISVDDVLAQVLSKLPPNSPARHLRPEKVHRLIERLLKRRDG